MAPQVLIHPRLQRQLTDTPQGKPGRPHAIAAHRARQILDQWARGMGPQGCGRMHPKPDKRIKNSLKFDLGSGFRLICIRKGQILHALFLGNHDQCDAWLNHYVRATPGKIPLSRGIRHTPPPRPRLHSPAPSNRSREEDPPLPPISQRYLRKVFCGICSSG